MRRKATRFLSFILLTVFLFNSLLVANASTTRASDYFAYTDVWATALGSGRVAVEFDINATDIMQELGAEKIYIWEQQSDGSYENVKTYTTGLIDKNTSAAYRMITYYGTSGVKYYATVVLYAKDSSGSEKLYSSTRVITA
ncbi:hypothetical protein [Dysosmobacter sp.]|uniref:hypothetical protein n=1 Tax=Dysosmobacter sp. TaxID=2591382 RepID=UPI003079A116